MKSKSASRSGSAPSAGTNGAVGEVLTLAEAATYLRLAEADVLNLIHAEGLPARFTGSEWRFLKSAIQQWLAAAASTKEARKAAQLALAGKYKDDPDLVRICEEAYRQRRRTTRKGE